MEILIPYGEYREIPLGNGIFARVDAVDFD